jgi:uncharacterized repeat protein (TIGR04076 family)
VIVGKPVRIRRKNMFKVKVVLKAFLGDEDKYPCHMQHRVGDEIIFDGERYIGRLCPDVWPLIVPKVTSLHQAGPRHIESPYYYPFWYAPPSVHDPAMKVYDGLGFRPVLSTHKEPQYHMANLAPPNAYKWPPHPERTVMKEIGVVCPDIRTAALFVLEAFDLAEKGFDTPFFRRQMTILNCVLGKPGIPEEGILQEFSRKERDEIYPPLSLEILSPLNDELVLMSYLERRDSGLFVTDKGLTKLEEFKKTLTPEERRALKL